MYIMFLMLRGAESCDVHNISLSVHLSAGSLLCLVNTPSSSKQLRKHSVSIKGKLRLLQTFSVHSVMSTHH